MELFVAPTLIGIIACVWLRIQQSRHKHHWLNRHPRLLWPVAYVSWFLLWMLGSAIVITFSPIIIGAFVLYVILKLIPVSKTE